jgi:transcriptional regulator with XRE-family HTH domain
MADRRADEPGAPAAAGAPPVSGLRQLREARGLDVPALAARSGVAARTIERLEAEAIRPQPILVAKLAAALGVTPLALRRHLSAVRRAHAAEREAARSRFQTPADDP